MKKLTEQHDPYLKWFMANICNHAHDLQGHNIEV